MVNTTIAGCGVLAAAIRSRAAACTAVQWCSPRVLCATTKTIVCPQVTKQSATGSVNSQKKRTKLSIKVGPPYTVLR